MSIFSLSPRRQVSLCRVFSLILIAASVLLLFFDRMMGFVSLLEAVLFLVYYGGVAPVVKDWMLALPALPAALYHFYRLFLFAKAGSVNLYFAEVLLLALTYTVAACLFLLPAPPRALRLVALALFALCILLGIWDIMDGSWVLVHHTTPAFPARLRHFLLYYIPDTLFWVLPFVMVGMRGMRGMRKGSF